MLNEELWICDALPPGYEQDEFARLKDNSPEIAGWNLLSIASAWSAYANEILLASCVEPHGRQEPFIGYLYMKTLEPSSPLDGQYFEVLEAYELYVKEVNREKQLTG